MLKKIPMIYRFPFYKPYKYVQQNIVEFLAAAMTAQSRGLEVSNMTVEF